MTASDVVTSSGMRSLSIAVIEEDQTGGDDVYFDPGAMAIRQDMIPSPGIIAPPPGTLPPPSPGILPPASPGVFSPPSPGFIFSGDEYGEDDELYMDSGFSLPPPTLSRPPQLNSAPPPVPGAGFSATLPGRHDTAHSAAFRAPPTTRFATLPPPTILSRPPPVLPPAPPPPKPGPAPAAIEVEEEGEDIYADVEEGEMEDIYADVDNW